MCMCYVILSACKEAYADLATITDLQVLHAVHCNCKIRPVLAAAATASEFNTTSILVQRLFSGDLEITEAHQQIRHTYQSF